MVIKRPFSGPKKKVSKIDSVNNSVVSLEEERKKSNAGFYDRTRGQ